MNNKNKSKDKDKEKDIDKNNLSNKIDKNKEKEEQGKIFYYEHGDYFSAEKIVDHKTEKNNIYHYVKWIGWPDHRNTWEPLENLENVLELLIEYEKNQAKLYTPRERKKMENFKQKIIKSNKDYYEIYPEDINYINETEGSLIRDIPLKILSFHKFDRKFYLYIDWQLRFKSGLKPKNSFVKYEDMKEKYPYELLEYLEQFIEIPPI
jgi:hypothetical protein